jgi:hypothetical protein
MTVTKRHLIIDNLNPASMTAAVRPKSAGEGKPGAKPPPCGIVDRVTLSSEGREKSRRYRVEHLAQRETFVKNQRILLPFLPGEPSGRS